MDFFPCQLIKLIFKLLMFSLVYILIPNFLFTGILMRKVYYRRCFILTCIKLTEALRLPDIFEFICKEKRTVFKIGFQKRGSRFEVPYLFLFIYIQIIFLCKTVRQSFSWKTESMNLFSYMSNISREIPVYPCLGF